MSKVLIGIDQTLTNQFRNALWKQMKLSNLSFFELLKSCGFTEKKKLNRSYTWSVVL
jgi:hypothetical protein